MRRLFSTLLVAGFGWAGASLTAQPALATDLCVGSKPSCFATIQAAVDGAHDGDTIKVGVGTFAGGITIDKSVRLIGAGAHATTIKGGGPVITIGQQLAPDPPTVSIRGVTITGGEVDARGEDAFAALGGGVFVEIAADFGRGATVTIADSVITGNRAAPGETVPDGDFALAQGGGIDNFGDLTLVNTKVTNNVAGAAPGQASLATEANAGGIYNHIQAALTLERSVVSGNHARVSLVGQRCGGLGWDLHSGRDDDQEQRRQREQRRARVVGSPDRGSSVARGRDPRGVLPGRVLRATSRDDDHEHGHQRQSRDSTERQRRRARECLRGRDRCGRPAPARAQHRQPQRRPLRLRRRRGRRWRRARGDGAGHDP